MLSPVRVCRTKLRVKFQSSVKMGELAGDRVRFERLLAAPANLVWGLSDQFGLAPRMARQWRNRDGRGRASRTSLRRPGHSRARAGLRAAVRSSPKHVAPFVPGEEAPMAGDEHFSFSLSRKESTALVLTQTPIAPEYISRSAAGWHGLLDILSAQIASEPPPDFVDTFHRVLPDYERLVAQQILTSLSSLGERELYSQQGKGTPGIEVFRLHQATAYVAARNDR